MYAFVVYHLFYVCPFTIIVIHGLRPRRWHPSLYITRRLHCNNLTYIGSRNDVHILWFESTKWLKQIGICENWAFLLLLLILYLIFIRKNPPNCSNGMRVIYMLQIYLIKLYLLDTYPSIVNLTRWRWTFFWIICNSWENDINQNNYSNFFVESMVFLFNFVI
jgi:hypothetical protein